MFFAVTINEPKLVQASKNVYDKYFMIKDMEVNSQGKLMDIDDQATNPFDLDNS